MQKVKHDFQLVNKEILSGNVYMIQNCFTLFDSNQSKVDRLQIIVVAKKYICVSYLFVSRMPKMCAIPQFGFSSIKSYTNLLRKILAGATHNVSTVTDNTHK